MYSKFENFMKKYLAPLADKMDKEVHLSAVKKAMVAMTPLLIIGSFCLIPEAIPNMIGENHVISQWILANLDIIYIPYFTPSNPVNSGHYIGKILCPRQQD